LNLPVSSKNGVSEIRALTGLRGVAALYVVFYHYFSPIRLTNPIMCLLGHGYLAVDLFFVLSGFVMALNYAGLFSRGVRSSAVRIFLSRRVARIYPLYLLALLVATGLVVIGYLNFTGSSLARAFWPNLLMVQNWGNWESIETPAWSISTEWFAYILFPFLLTWIFYRSRARAFTVFILCVSGLASLAAFFTSPYDHLKVFDLTQGYPSLIRCVSEFTLGIIAYRVKDSRFGATAKDLPWLPLTLIVLLVLLLALKRTDVLVVLLFPLLILSLDGKRNFLNHFLGSRVPEFLGLVSYSVYLVHYLLVPVLNGMDSYVRRHGLSHAHSYAVAVVFPLMLLCASCTYFFIEIPGRRSLRVLLDSDRRTVRTRINESMIRGE
jgi:peptidoglycan/LPS O-acetylase OafA/YrhL